MRRHRRAQRSWCTWILPDLWWCAADPGCPASLDRTHKIIQRKIEAAESDSASMYRDVIKKSTYDLALMPSLHGQVILSGKCHVILVGLSGKAVTFSLRMYDLGRFRLSPELAHFRAWIARRTIYRTNLLDSQWRLSDKSDPKH